MPDKYDLSRRKLLAGLGIIGGAGAIGGGATSALLTDEEVFGTADAPNILQAGELDLKVDWAEHYVDWIGAETEFDAMMVEDVDDVPADHVPLPTPENPMLAVPEEQIGAFMEATTTETSDGFDGPDDVEREEARDLVDQPDPVITIDDVKPGDFGEVTFSYHLFGNPGWVTACAEVLADDDTGVTEPEDKVDGHTPNGSDGDTSEEDDFDGELGDHVRATLWYDPNCNNRRDTVGAETMFMVDVSESMSSEFPGVDAGVDGDTGDATRLEGVRAAMGDVGGSGFLSSLADCPADLEVGTVSASEDLHHLDNLDDGDDTDRVGFDDGNVDANLDKSLTPTDAGDYTQLKHLYAGGTDFSPDFVTDDPINNGADVDGNGTPDEYEAERPYVENGDSTQTMGVRRAHRAILPSDYTGARDGIDPSGNAAAPGEAEKVIVVITDGAFAAEQQNEMQTANNLRDAAEQDGIEIQPVIVNSTPSGNDVSFADALATAGRDPLFAVQYDGTPESCDSDVTDAGFTCDSLVGALASLRSDLCATGSSDQVIADGTLNEVMTALGAFDGTCDTPLNPRAAGASVAGGFEGTDCHAPSTDGCFALAWWVPRDIPGVDDNIIQTDSYEFTISINAVQCRHNVTDDGEPIDLSPGAADAQSGGD